MANVVSGRLLECVPNFSEGVDMGIIDHITNAVKSVEGVKLLNVDPGAATNRTVVTFVGSPEAVVEAAFRAVKKSSEVIDMRKHHGAHPRMGACDVLPLVPVAGITLEEAAVLAQGLAKRIADEIGVPTYCYEAAARKEDRKNLATVRAGEYEGLAKKIVTDQWKPDFGKAEFTEQAAKSGATIVGARDFLVAVNYNLNTTSTRRANAIAFDVREKGRTLDKGEWAQKDDGLWTKVDGGKKSGEKVNIPGTLKGCKAIGWFIDEYGIAQVSMNITNISQTPLHVAFEAVCDAAAKRGIRVTGVEIVGLVPLKVLIDAGKYFLIKQERSVGVSDQEIIKIAVRTMGLSELNEFVPREKVIEYLIEDCSKKRLVDMTCNNFAQETASESPAPGGGSIAAYMASLGAALGVMVANLSSHKAGWDDKWEYFSNYAQMGQGLIKELLNLVDEDTNAFNKIMDAFGLPKGSDAEKMARTQAIQDATLYATMVPLRTMEVACGGFELIEEMASKGNPNSVTDAGVGALALRSAVLGAFLNVKINASGLKDRAKADQLVKSAQRLADSAVEKETQILKIVDSKI